MDAVEVKKREAEGVPWNFGKRVVTKKGRSILYGDEKKKSKRKHNHAFRG